MAAKLRSRKVRRPIAKGRNSRVAAAVRQWKKHQAKHRGGDDGCFGTLVSAFKKTVQKDFNIGKEAVKTARKQNNFDWTAAPRSSLKIGEVSQISGIGIEALRFYERSGILGKPARTASGYRLYDAEVLDRLAFIKKAQTLGFSLDEIRRIIAESKTGECPCEEVREIVRRRLQELDERLREMRRYRKELAATLFVWDEQGTAEGDVCGLIEGTQMESYQPAASIIGRKSSLKEKKKK